jgi:allantoinase
MLTLPKHNRYDYSVIGERNDYSWPGGIAQPLVMTLSLHPFVVGQPFRLPPLRKALKHCVEHPKRDRVWWTTPGAVADVCYALPPGTIPG